VVNNSSCVQSQQLLLLLLLLHEPRDSRALNWQLLITDPPRSICNRHCFTVCLIGRFTNSAKAQIFPPYDSAKKLLHKRNSDRYREPQQRFTKPQTTPATASYWFIATLRINFRTDLHEIFRQLATHQSVSQDGPRYWFTAKWPLFSSCLFVCLSVCLCRVFLSRLWSDFDQNWIYVISMGLVVSPRI